MLSNNGTENVRKYDSYFGAIYFQKQVLLFYVKSSSDPRLMCCILTRERCLINRKEVLFIL